MEIIPINETYIHQIALLHKKSYPKYHFSSRFSIKFLEDYFRFLIKNLEFSFMLVGYNKELIGYFIGGSNSSGAMSVFNRENWFQIVLFLLKNPSFIWEKIFLLIDNITKSKSKVSNRFSGYVICVDPDAHVPSAGYELIRNFENKLIENSIKEYYISIRPENHKVIEWYEHMNFVEFEKKKTTIVYKKNLS